MRAAPRAIGPLALESKGVWAPGVLLVGDAAGFLDPFTGEGVALALRGAALAAEVGHRTLNGRGSLAEYHRRHRQMAREKFRFNKLVQWLIAHPAAANISARVLARLPALADRLVGVAGDCLPVTSRPRGGAYRYPVQGPDRPGQGFTASGSRAAGSE